MMKEHCHCHIDEKLSGHSVPFVKPCVRIKEGEDDMVPITPNQLLMNNLAVSVEDDEPNVTVDSIVLVWCDKKSKMILMA